MFSFPSLLYARTHDAFGCVTSTLAFYIEIATDRFTPGEAYAFTQYKPRDQPANGYNYVAQPSNGKCICRGGVLYPPLCLHYLYV